MAKKPIPFCNDMVLASLDLRKARTSRIMNPQPIWVEHEDEGGHVEWSCKRWPNLQVDGFVDLADYAPYEVGDELYVKEAYQINYHSHYVPIMVKGRYLADNKLFCLYLSQEEGQLLLSRKYPKRKTPARFMYKSLGRIFLPPIERITVQRPQDLTEEEAKLEGVFPITTYRTETLYKDSFMWLWRAIHGKGSWERNDWCFVYHWDASKIEVRR